MSRANLYFDDYSLFGFEQTLQKKSNWNIDDAVEFENRMFKLQLAALDDFRQQALITKTIDEREIFTSESMTTIQGAVSKIYPEASNTERILYEIGNRFLAEARFFVEVTEGESVWKIPSTPSPSSETRSTFTDPVANIRALISEDAIQTLREEFYDTPYLMPYGKPDEELAIEEYYKDYFVDENTENLPQETKDQLIKMQTDPGNLVSIVHHFSDYFLKTITEEINVSKTLIKTYCHKNPDARKYTKAVAERIRELLKASSELLEKYPEVKRTLVELKSSLSASNLPKILGEPLNSAIDQSIKFELAGSIPQPRRLDIAEIIFEALKKFADCKKHQVEALFGYNGELKEKIILTANLYTLHYFIDALKPYLKPGGQGKREEQWKIAANCFLGKNYVPFTNRNIGKAKKTANYHGADIDQMIQKIQKKLTN